ncbi:MAG: amylo-alpha-1,6-glucosidase [Anaerolineae bacterium]|nr:amylo-alpha-1,6-glucosidase [Anaerolineae bacterium]
MLSFERDVCNDLHSAARREWLVTNGIGGYASGTIAGLPTRSYHGLLVAALEPPVGRTLLLTKLDETAEYAGRTYPLFATRWADGTVAPEGFRHIDAFRLEGSTPVWTFALADALLEKRVWMVREANTTCVCYHLHRASAPLTLRIDAVVNWRDHHVVTRAAGRRFSVECVPHGLRVAAPGREMPLYLLSRDAAATPQHAWHAPHLLSVEAYRGLEALDEALHAGTFTATLHPGQTLTLVASIDPAPELDGGALYDRQQAYDQRVVEAASAVPAPLALAADQFIVRRALPADPDGRTVIAGYHWFGDWGRDTMIALPGLTLATGRFDVAARILRTFAHYVDRGMLPNRFPDTGAQPEYNTVDATLWYVEALRATHAATGDDDLLRDLFPVLDEIVDWHLRGTRYGIHVDPADGLVAAGEPGVQLTWMDAKVDDWVVTPRIGKPVEINALWYNALRAMADLAPRVGQSPERYVALARQARAGFERFWNAEAGYCYDVLDGPAGHDPALRPNQLFAVSLPHSPLAPERQRAVVDACARHLLTPHGLRSLTPHDPAYVGQYGGDRRQRDAAYHQGTVWGWLIGPFVTAHLRVYDDREQARAFLLPLLDQLSDHGVGTISEIFDGDPPFTPRGCIAQAWSVAEMLRVFDVLC